MSSLTEDATGRQVLTFSERHSGDYLVCGTADGKFLTISFQGVLVTVVLPSAAVAEKFGELLERMGQLRRYDDEGVRSGPSFPLGPMQY